MSAIPSATISDALAADLRDCLRAAPPFTFPSASVRLALETDDLPSPRIVILPEDEKRISGMPGTARVTVAIHYISSMDRTLPANHRTSAGLLEEWILSLRSTKRRSPLSTRVYLHDVFPATSKQSIRTEEREQVAILAADWVVTRIADTGI